MGITAIHSDQFIKATHQNRTMALSFNLTQAMFTTTYMMSPQVDYTYQQHTFNVVVKMNNALNSFEENLARDAFDQIIALKTNKWTAVNDETECNCDSPARCGPKPVFCGAMVFYLGILERKCISNFNNRPCDTLTASTAIRTTGSVQLSLVGTQDAESLQGHINKIHYEACLNILALQTLKMEQALPANVPSMLNDAVIPDVAGVDATTLKAMETDAKFVKLHGGSHLMIRFLDCMTDLDYSVGHEHVHI